MRIECYEVVKRESEVGKRRTYAVCGSLAGVERLFAEPTDDDVGNYSVFLCIYEAEPSHVIFLARTTPVQQRDDLAAATIEVTKDGAFIERKTRKRIGGEA